MMQVGVWKQIRGEWDFAVWFVLILEYKFILLEDEILPKKKFIYRREQFFFLYEFFTIREPPLL